MVKTEELVDIDSIDMALEKRFSETPNCCSTQLCYCDVAILKHRREYFRLKDKAYQELEI